MVERDYTYKISNVYSSKNVAESILNAQKMKKIIEKKVKGISGKIKGIRYYF